MHKASSFTHNILCDLYMKNYNIPAITMNIENSFMGVNIVVLPMLVFQWKNL